MKFTDLYRVLVICLVLYGLAYPVPRFRISHDGLVKKVCSWSWNNTGISWQNLFHSTITSPLRVNLKQMLGKTPSVWNWLSLVFTASQVTLWTTCYFQVRSVSSVLASCRKHLQRKYKVWIIRKSKVLKIRILLLGQL